MTHLWSSARLLAFSLAFTFLLPFAAPAQDGEPLPAPPAPEDLCGWSIDEADRDEKYPEVYFKVNVTWWKVFLGPDGQIVDESTVFTCYGDKIDYSVQGDSGSSGTASLELRLNQAELFGHAFAEQSERSLGEPTPAVTVLVTPYVIHTPIGTSYAFNGETTSILNRSGGHPDNTPTAGFASLPSCTACQQPGGSTSPFNIGAFSGGRLPDANVAPGFTAGPELGYVRTFDFTIKAFTSIPIPSTLYPGPHSALADHTLDLGITFNTSESQDDGPNSCDGEASPNSINAATGNEYHREVDYESAGENPLRLVRHYNSRQSKDLLGFGPGWASNFNVSMVAVGRNRYQWFRQGDGNGRLFKQAGGGAFAPPPGFGGKFGLSPTGFLQVTDESDVSWVIGNVGKVIQVRNLFGHTQDISYNGSNIDTITDSNGRTLTFVYTGSLVSEVITPDGRRVKYLYDALSNLEFVVYPDDTPGDDTDNPRIRYLYEDANFPTALTGRIDEREIRTHTWAYEAVPLLEKSVFDDEKRAILSETTGGERFEVAYDFGTRQTISRNVSGRERVFSYTRKSERRRADITQVEGLPSPNCSGSARYITYDANGFVLTRTDDEGNVTEFLRDFRGLVTQKREGLRWENDIPDTTLVTTPETRTTTNVWNSSRRYLSSEAAPGKTTAFIRSNGRITSLKETDITTHTVPYSTNGTQRETVTSYTYHANGVTVATETVDGQRTDVNDVMTRVFDSSGNLAGITNALGHVTQFQNYDANGRPGRVIDENGVVTDMTYDPRGRLKTVTLNEPVLGPLTTEFIYFPNGLLNKTVLPNGSYIGNVYNDASQLVRLVSGLRTGTNAFTVEQSIDYTPSLLTGEWETATTKDAAGTVVRIQQRVFDELGRLRQVLGQASQQTQFHYDKNDQLTKTEEVGASATLVTDQAYDVLNRLQQTTDAREAETTFGYDNRDNLTAVTDARTNTTTYVYDGFGNLLQESSPDAGTTVFQYDLADNLVYMVDARGIESQQTFDALNRLTSTTYPVNPAKDITYSYDTPVGTNAFTIGRLSHETYEEGSASYGYDARGNITNVQEQTGSLALATTYEFNEMKQVSKIIYPSGRIVEYSYDALGRPSDVDTKPDANAVASTVVTGITYQPFGPANGYLYGNGLERDVVFDTDYRITGINILDGGAAVRAWNYGYDSFDNISLLEQVDDPTRSQDFFYDELHRLTDASGPYGDISYSYDAVGNRLTCEMTDGAGITTETYAYSPPGTGNRLLSVDDGTTLRTFQHDDAGNVIKDDKGTGTKLDLTFDEQNRLSTVIPEEVQ